MTCTATADGNDITISWNDETWSRVSIFRNNGWIETITDNTTQTTDQPGQGTFTYTARGFIDGQRFDATCANITTDTNPDPSPCVARLNADGTVTVTRSVDDGATSWVVRRSVNQEPDAFIGIGEDLSFTDVEVPVGDVTYIVRSRFPGGVVDDVTCTNA